VFTDARIHVARDREIGRVEPVVPPPAAGATRCHPALSLADRALNGDTTSTGCGSALWRAFPLRTLRLRPDVPNVHRKDTVFYWLLKCVVLGPVLKLLFRPDVTGLSNVPRSGPVILACNHLSFSDSIFTPLMVRRRVTFVAKAEYFTGKGIKGWLMRQFFANTGTIPVDRSGGEAARAALDTAATRRSSPRGGVVPAGR
jgi:1-acyl-sn-glycerol-3-phosphate acyltransferase